MVVEIDGSILEGGGQILRMSIALSVLRQIPIRMQKIRANRLKGGLAAQHLTGIRLAKDICQGQLENDSLGSTEISFTPCKIRSGKFIAETGTCGSVALLLQTALPCVLFGNEQSYLTLKGGTNASLAPQIDYVKNVLRPTLQKFGANFDVEIIKRGINHKNGVIDVTVYPVSKLYPINLVDFGDVESIQGEAFVTGFFPFQVAAKAALVAENVLKRSVKAKISVKPVKFKSSEAFGCGSGINLLAKTTTGCYLESSAITRKKRDYDMELETAQVLLESINKKYCVDQKMQDQMILFMALADGKSRVRTGPITSHTETAIYLAELLTTAKFNIINLKDGTNIIECDGIGQQNEYLTVTNELEK